MACALGRLDAVTGIIYSEEVYILIDATAADIHLRARLVFLGYAEVAHHVRPGVADGAHHAVEGSARLC